jgi:hypothetical protein
MKQYEAVIEALRENGGFATLGRLYADVMKIEGVSWETKTPFKSINRIVQQRPEIFRIRPGLWALEEFRSRLPKQLTAKDESEIGHTYYQGLVVELGNLDNLKTYVPPQDRNRLFINKKLGDVITSPTMLEFTYDEYVRKARSIDVVWFNARNMPSAFIEIEHTTDFQNSLLKFLTLQDFNASFRIVAPESRKRTFEDKIGNVAFKPISERVRFFTFEDVGQIHSRKMALASLGSDW